MEVNKNKKADNYSLKQFTNQFSTESNKRTRDGEKKSWGEGGQRDGEKKTEHKLIKGG